MTTSFSYLSPPNIGQTFKKYFAALALLVSFSEQASAAASDLRDGYGTVWLDTNTPTVNGRAVFTWTDITGGASGGATLTLASLTLLENADLTLDLSAAGYALTITSLVLGKNSTFRILKPATTTPATITFTAITAHPEGCTLELEPSVTFTANPSGSNDKTIIRCLKDLTITGPATTLTAQLILNENVTLSTITGLAGVLDGPGKLTGSALTTITSKPGKKRTGGIVTGAACTVDNPGIFGGGSSTIGANIIVKNKGTMNGDISMGNFTLTANTLGLIIKHLIGTAASPTIININNVKLEKYTGTSANFLKAY